MSVTRISFEATNACNLDCPHCLRDNKAPRAYLPPEYVEKALSQARRYGTQLCFLTGGEPLLHPEINRIIEIIVARGYAFVIVTNGTLLDRIRDITGNRAWIKNLMHLSISLDGPTAESNDFIRGEGNYIKVMKTVSYARSKGVKVGFKTAINTVNCDRLDEMANLSARLGAVFLELSNMIPTGELIRRKLMLPGKEWIKVDRQLEKLRSTYRIPINMCTGFRTDSIFHQCFPLTLDSVHFDHRGNMAACCMLTNYRQSANESELLGNIGEFDFWDLHSKQIKLTADINREKIRKIRDNEVMESDHYPCIFCLKYFRKLDWLKDLDPQNEWISDVTC